MAEANAEDYTTSVTADHDRFTLLPDDTLGEILDKLNCRELVPLYKSSTRVQQYCDQTRLLYHKLTEWSGLECDRYDTATVLLWSQWVPRRRQCSPANAVYFETYNGITLTTSGELVYGGEIVVTDIVAVYKLYNQRLLLSATGQVSHYYGVRYGTIECPQQIVKVVEYSNTVVQLLAVNGDVYATTITSNHAGDIYPKPWLVHTGVVDIYSNHPYFVVSYADHMVVTSSRLYGIAVTVPLLTQPITAISTPDRWSRELTVMLQAPTGFYLVHMPTGEHTYYSYTALIGAYDVVDKVYFACDEAQVTIEYRDQGMKHNISIDESALP